MDAESGGIVRTRRETLGRQATAVPADSGSPRRLPHRSRHTGFAGSGTRFRGLASRLAVLVVLHFATFDSVAQIGAGLQTVAPGTIATVAGTGEFNLGDGDPVSNAGFERVSDVAADRAGNLYIADSCCIQD